MEETKIISSTIEQIQETADLFYRNQEQPGYLSLRMTIEDITQAIDTISQLESIDSEAEIAKINGALSEALNAMQEKDMTLVADILTYDVADLFKKILEQIG